MKLIVQPRDGLTTLISAIKLAKKELDLVIFRFDRPEIEKALDAAVKRAVRVRTLIAHTNHGGEKNLRKLEQKLLEAGATVARTGDDFIRYHGKLMIVDRSTLWLLGFNFTALDISGSRSFGIVTKQKAVVQEALKLFEADAARQSHEPAGSGLVISPENARRTLADFLGQAKQQLLIYDPKVSDRAMVEDPEGSGEGRGGCTNPRQGQQGRQRPSARALSWQAIARSRHRSRPPRSVRGKSEPQEARAR